LLFVDLMRLRGGEISEDLLDQKLHVATNYLDRLAQKFKIDYDLLDFGDLIASGGFRFFHCFVCFVLFVLFCLISLY
jgi:hypothetical protein